MTEPSPSLQYRISLTPGVNTIHWRSCIQECLLARGLVKSLDEPISEVVLTTSIARDVTCRECLAYIALNEPVLLLDDWLQQAVNKLMDCKRRGENFGAYFYFRRVASGKLALEFQQGTPAGSVEVK